MSGQRPASVRAFMLLRDHDETGVSGVGHVADGVQFADDTVVLRWLGEFASTVVWDSLLKAMAVHGHDGRTRVEWYDESCPMSYRHPECGFAWHGKDGLDVPTRDGQPVCPRCELKRLTESEGE